jgi:putative membrane protein
MMDYGYGGGGWIWAFGGLMMIGVLVLVGLAAWAVIAATRRESTTAAVSTPADVGGRQRTRQILDERYARGEMNSEEYTERLHTLGL